MLIFQVVAAARLRHRPRQRGTTVCLARLEHMGKQCNAAVCQKLQGLGLVAGVCDAPEPLVLMRD